MKPTKKDINRLNEVFKEIGFHKIAPTEPIHKIEAEMIAETEGANLETLRHTLDRCEQTGKLCYPSENAAHNAMRRRQNAAKQRLRVYFCPDCKAHHLTSYA